MSHLLQINSSLHGEDGESTRLAAAYVADWRWRHPDGEVTLRDLAHQPVPHLDAERFAAHNTPPAKRTPRQAELAALGDTLIAELQRADVVVLAVPMYNLGVPSTLKAWFDYVARAGTTFRYTADGPEGLLAGRQAVVFATRGGLYAGTEADSQTPHVTQFLGLLGITDVHWVYAEGLAMGDDRRHEAVTAAQRELQRIAA